VLSGPGLYNIYAGLCRLGGQKPLLEDPPAIFEHLEDETVRAAIRLMTEFFGVFAAGLVVGGNAYGGLYIMGGIFDRLRAHDMFDLAHFEQFFVGRYVPSVKTALDRTKIVHVQDPLLSMR